MAKDSTDLKQAMFAAGDAVIGAAVLIGVGVVAGNFLDSKLHTAPWLVVTLSLLGGGLGLWRMVHKATQMGKDEGNSADPLEPEAGSTGGDDLSSAPQRPLPEHKPREMKDTKARSAFEFLDQGDSESKSS